MDGADRTKSVIWGVTGERYSLEKDIRGEGGRSPIRVSLTGLEEERILSWWRDFNRPSWSLLNTNCAQVAADALRAGGATKHVGWRDWTDSWNSVWTPMDVLRFARAIEVGLRRN